MPREEYELGQQNQLGWIHHRQIQFDEDDELYPPGWDHSQTSAPTQILSAAARNTDGLFLHLRSEAPQHLVSYVD